ncbi:MAG: hypothetical protein NC133_03155, partial [Prevotella sp.]|nr:hypothetical protein [Prevotella sp.]
MKKQILLLIQHLTRGGAERVVTLWAQMLVDAGYAVTVLTFYPLPHEYPLDSRITRVNLVTSFEQYTQFHNKQVTCKKLFEQFLTAHPHDLLMPFLTTSNLIAATCNQTHIQTITRTIRNSPWGEEQGLNLAVRDWAIQKQGSVILQNN